MSLVLERHGGLSGVGLSGTGSIWDGVCQGRGLSGVGLSGTGGYVDVDEKSGKVVWRYDNLTDPSLPILDIYGDVIGTDGRHLIKINDDGTVQKPIIKIYDKDPMYSIQVANDNLLLMVSQEGLLITYATNGIPEASLTIRDELERVNGTFLPVAQPVIYGKRAYILMQFAPDAPLSPDKQGLVLGLQRLYAIDLWARMVKRIDPVWYVNFERLSCPSDVIRPLASPNDDVESDSSVLQQITGYDSRNGSVRHVLDVSKLLNTTCRITSKVMVAMSEKNAPPIGERLVFGVACLANQSAPIGDVNIHHHHRTAVSKVGQHIFAIGTP
nr:hypothetical protein BaRGS_025793 [Batillaria attramentaria]